MGMFLPPVANDNEKWTDDRNYQASITAMAEYSRRVRAEGFYVLNYFNVHEVGKNVKRSRLPRKTEADTDLWKDPTDFVFYKLGDAVLYDKAGNPDGAWEGGVLCDSGEPVYRQFFLEQARRHIEKLPQSSGICIDRMDFIRRYNLRRDDGVTWIGKPVRSLVVSWHDLMSKLGPLMHDAGKVIYCNPLYRRVDLLRHQDGIYDEFGQVPFSLNLCSLMGLRNQSWRGHPVPRTCGPIPMRTSSGTCTLGPTSLHPSPATITRFCRKPAWTSIISTMVRCSTRCAASNGCCCRT